MLSLTTSGLAFAAFWMQLTTGVFPAVAAEDDTIHLTWQDGREGERTAGRGPMRESCVRQDAPTSRCPARNPRKGNIPEGKISVKDPSSGFDGTNETFRFHSDVLCQQHLPALLPLDQQDAMSDLTPSSGMNPKLSVEGVEIHPLCSFTHSLIVQRAS